MPDRLPGFGTIQRRRGRNERGVDGIAKWLRELGQYGPWEQALVTLGRTSGASLDRLEHDADRSEHVVGNVARVHLQIVIELRPSLTTTADAFDRLSDELSAAIRNPPPT